MFTTRSQEKELMDLGSSFYTKEEYEQCSKQLFKINQLLGVFNHTIQLLKQVPSNSSITDVGCGGGLFLLHLSQYYPEMLMEGIDISKDAITLAQNELQRWKNNNLATHVNFNLQIHHELDFAPDSRDIILLNLVCHHIEDDALSIFLQKALASVRVGLIINDLQRSRISYWFYKICCPLFFKNRLIRHDGLVSIQRSFTRKELHYFLKQAHINHYQIKWCFPFRWSVMVWKK